MAFTCSPHGGPTGVTTLVPDTGVNVCIFTCFFHDGDFTAYPSPPVYQYPGNRFENLKLILGRTYSVSLLEVVYIIEDLRRVASTSRLILL